MEGPFTLPLVFIFSILLQLFEDVMCSPFTNVCCLFFLINLFNAPNEQASVWLVHLTPSPYNSLGFHDNLFSHE